MSYHRLNTKPLNASLAALLKRGAHLGVGLGAMAPMLALANPSGGQVVGGQANISNPGANGVVVKQTSQSAIINWQQFNIGQGQYVQFIQPSSSSVVLNRVVGGGASSIFGSLTGNGQVFLVNSNGVYFGKSATLDLQGFLASTLDISDGNFLAGHYVFDQAGAPGATITNEGKLRAHKGGYIILAGDYAQNDGLIAAQSGHVILASGAKTTLNLNGNQLVNFAVNQATLASYAGVTNTGKLIADGGTVLMTADVANALKATVVNNSGLIEAHAINKNGGTIQLLASGGNIQNAGALDANATKAGIQGGAITLKGDEKTLLTPTSNITALGDAANGGHLEVSGNTIAVRGGVELGRGGDLLLDPGKITLITGTGNGSSLLNSGGLGEGNSVTVGVGFIETQLNADVNVGVSAHLLITDSPNVHAISATGAGNLTIKTGTGGQVQLGGASHRMDITIAGGLTASFGYGSFGYLQAKTISLHGGLSSGDFIHLADALANSKGAITRYSAKTTNGGLSIIVGGQVTVGGGSGEFGLALKATQGSIDFGGKLGNISGSAFGGNVDMVGKAVNITQDMKVNGAVTLTGSHGYATFHRIRDVDSGAKVTISATKGRVFGSSISGHGGVTVTATSGDVDLGGLNNGIGDVQITATGGGTISAGGIADGSGNIVITDTSAKTKVHTLADDHGNITVNAKGQVLSFTSNNAVTANGNVTLTAKTISQTGTQLMIVDTGNITIGGQISLAPNFSSSLSVITQIGHGVTLQAGATGTIKLDHSIAVPGSVIISGGHLALTGAAKTFSLSAGFNPNLVLDASIGSAAHPVKYNVNLVDKGGQILIERSIYTGNTAGGLAANVTMTEKGHDSGDSKSGVLLGSAEGLVVNPVVVSTLGNLTVKGYNVGVGNEFGTDIFGAATLKAGKNATFSASGGGSGGNLVMRSGIVTNSIGVANHAILVQAGGNLLLKGAIIDVSGGQATALLSHGAPPASAAVLNSVTLKATGNVTLAATGTATLQGGEGIATASASAGGAHKTTVNTSVNLTAGKALSISAQHINVSAGYGVGKASAIGANAVADATVNTSVNLKAGTTLTLDATGSHLGLRGANNAGSLGHAVAQAPGAKADVGVNASANLTAAAISLTGGNVLIEAGNNVGFQNSSNHAVKGFTSGSAQETLTADVNLTAGLGGIAVTAATGNVGVEGGSHLVQHAFVDAQDGTATLDAQARANLKTTGSLTLKAHNAVDISAGASVASITRASAGEAGVAGVKADAGVGITTVNLSVTADSAAIKGGRSVGYSNSAHAFGSVNAPGQADIHSLARVDITAKGSVTVTTGHALQILAGRRAGAQSSATGSLHYNAIASNSGAAKATVSADGGVALTAGGNINLSAGTAEGANLFIEGGSRAGQYAALNATGAGSASFHALSRVDITAKGTFTAKTTGGLEITGGSDELQSAVASVGGSGKAKSTADAGLGIKAAAITVQGGNAVKIAAGSQTAFRASVDAAGGSANLSAKGDVSVIATGKLTVLSAHSDVQLKAGSEAAFGARAGLNGSDTGKAAIAASGNLNLQGGTVSVTASSGHVYVDAGYGIAGHAKAHAGAGGQQSVSGQGNISLNATAGGITLKGKKAVSVVGGFSAAAGGHSGHGSNSFISSGGTGSTHFVKTRLFNFNQTDFTEVLAQGAGAKATVGGTATVNLSATGGISLLMTGATGSSAILEAGYGAAADVHASASGGGVATVHAANGVIVKAGGKLSLTGREAALGGGAVAMHGAPSDESSHVIRTCVTGHPCTFNTTFTNHTPPPADQAKGAGTQVSISANDSVNIKAGSVAFSAHNANVLLNAGGAAGQHLHGLASSGGQVSFQHVGGIDIVATGAVTATAFNSFLVDGAAHSSAALLTADGKGALVRFNTGAGISLTGATVSVAARTGIGINAGENAGQGAVLTAGNNGIAGETVTDGVEITAKTSFKAALTGSGSGGGIAIDGGFFGGASAHLTASNAGLATLTAQADLGIQVTAAGGTLVISAGKHANGELSISGGGYLARFAHVKADHGSASLDASGGITFAAKGAVTLAAAAAAAHLTINAREDIGSDAHGSGSSHGQATLRGMSNISVSGGNVTLKTGGDLNVFGGKSGEGAQAVIKAGTGGAAQASFGAVTSFKAAGALNLTAGANLLVAGARDNNGEGAKVSAGSSAQATLNLSDSVLLSGHALLTLKATHDLSVAGDTAGGMGESASIKAGAHASAVMDQTESATLLTSGVFTAQAGHNLSFHGASNTGRDAKINATGAGAQATYTADGRLNVSANSIRLSAGHNLRGHGHDSVAAAAVVNAAQGGSALFDADVSLDFTAVTGFSAKLTGSSAAGDVQFYGGQDNGHSAQAKASNAASKAILDTTQAVNIIVTGAAGTITLVTGNHAGASIYLGGSTSDGRLAKAMAFHGGSAAVTVDNDVVLSAKGAITLNANLGNASLVAGWNENGESAMASASAGGKAKLVTDSNLSITGASIAVHGGHSVDVLAARSANAERAQAKASYGGAASDVVNANLTLKAVTGALSLTAGSSMSIAAASRDTLLSAAVHASHGGAQANLALNGQLQLSGATAVTLTAGKNLAITGGPIASTAGHDTVVASYGGKANFNDDTIVSIVTPGAFSAKAVKVLSIFGAYSMGKHASITAAHAGAKATAEYDGTVTISAKTESLLAGSSLSVSGGGNGARQAFISADYGGAAVLDTQSGVQLNAKTALSMTLTGSVNGGRIAVLGGTGALLADASVGSHGGVADIAVDSAVGMKVAVTGGTLTVSAGKHKGALISLGNVSGQASHAQAAAKGGSASVNVDGGLNLQAAGAVTVNAGASGMLSIGRARAVARNATVLGSGGHAAVQAHAETDIAGASLTFTAGKNIALMGGGVNMGNSARASGTRSGTATLDIDTGTRITATGLFTAVAGGELVVTANSFAGDHISDASVGAGAKAGTSNGAGRSGFNALDGVRIAAGSITLKAGTELIVDGGHAVGRHAAVTAKSSSGSAVFSALDDVEITAIGALSLTAGQGVTISGGNSLGRSASIKAEASGGNAVFTGDGTVDFKAGTILTVRAASVSLNGGGSLVDTGLVSAAGRGANATLTALGGVNVTAAAISMIATSSNLNMAGGHDEALGGVAHAGTSAHAAITANGAVNLKATGALMLTAIAGSVSIGGGSGTLVFSMGKANAKGSNATAALDAENGISITAGGTLTLKAGANLTLAGGHEQFASAAASSSGSAMVKLGTGVTLKAGTTLSLNASGGSLAIHGGNANGILLNTAYTPGATSKSSQVTVGTGVGKTSGQLDAAVSLSAGGDVNLKAANSIAVTGGGGVTLAVGALRELTSSGVRFHGSDWAGGSAQISAAVGATVTAGHNLNVSAGLVGSGSLKVQGLRQNVASSSGFINLETVRGGSNNAVAKLSLDADSLLSAGNDLVLNVNGNASVAGGQLSFVAADHSKGKVNITGSADAGIHAGHDVVLNKVTGDLMVAGFTPGSIANHAMSVTALGAHGFTSVTGHADATIIAGHDIRTVTALGGDLDITGGHSVHVLVPGGGLGASGVNLATGTAKAELSAGSSILLSAKGGLNAHGGSADHVSAGTAAVVSANPSFSSRIGKLTVSAGIKANKAVSLSLTGSASIAGGAGLHVNAGFAGGSFTLANATGDASVSISGGSLRITTGKGLHVFGGDSDRVGATASQASSLRAAASADAGAMLSAAGNVTLTVGLLTHSNASFQGGSRVLGEAQAKAGGSASVSAVAHSDVLVKAGGSLSLTLGGNLTVAGGPFTQTLPLGSGIAVLASGSASAAKLHADTDVSADAGFSAGGNLTLVLKGGTANITGGGDIASLQEIMTGGQGNNQAVLDAEARVSLHAGGALKLSGAAAVNVTAGAFAAGSHLPALTSIAGNATATLKSGVSISGNSVNLNGGVGVSTTSLHVLTTGGLVQDGRVSITAVIGSPILVAPAPLSLGSLQSQGLVVNLVTLLAPAMDAAPAATLYTPGDFGKLTMTSYTGSCAALVQRSDGRYRCAGHGGK